MLATDAASPGPRLARLRADLAAGDDGALARFWAEIADTGTPLIEPLSDAPGHSLVTFLWRATGAHENVVVTGGLCQDDFAAHRMANLPETDLWFRSYRLADDLRTAYRLAPNDPLTPTGPGTDWAARTAHWHLDPLNHSPFPTTAPWTSTFALPAAPPQPWSDERANVSRGTITQVERDSALLGNRRTIFVYTPPGYDPAGAPLDLLVLFDGSAYLDWVPTPTILDNLLADGELPRTVAVIVGNPSQETRSRELPCHPPMAAFLATELLPWARENYRVTTDPARTTIGGSSYGGLAATFAAFTHPELFGNVLSQSGSFWWKPGDADEHEWLTRQFADAPRRPLHLYLDVGLLETGGRADGPSQVETNRRLRDLLLAKDYPLHYAEFNGGHDYVCWRGTLADGLRALRRLRTPTANTGTPGQ